MWMFNAGCGGCCSRPTVLFAGYSSTDYLPTMYKSHGYDSSGLIPGYSPGSYDYRVFISLASYWDETYFPRFVEWMLSGGKRMFWGVQGILGQGTNYVEPQQAEQANRLMALLGVSMRVGTTGLLLNNPPVVDLAQNGPVAIVPGSYFVSGLTALPGVVENYHTNTAFYLGAPYYLGTHTLSGGTTIGVTGDGNSVGASGPAACMAIERLPGVNSEVVLCSGYPGYVSAATDPFFLRFAELDVP